ncbi:MAG: hypothetical protein ILP08_04815, partial [Lachnospiraceae bacterium]|nr:hypothetical protein [Lachnospiraceae bacterium]
VLSMCEKCPGLNDKYRSYFSYNIMQLFLLSYEDYHILKPLLFSILYTELLMIFDLTRYTEGIRKDKDYVMTRETETETLYLMESCVRHNPYLTQNLLNVMRQETL